MADLPISARPAATLPLTGGELSVLVQGGVTKQTSLANHRLTLGSTVLAIGATESTVAGLTLGSGSVWSGDVVAGQYGGTGVANTGKTITLGGNLTLSGAHALTLTQTGPTNVTLPTTGTLATLAGTETLINKTLVAAIANQLTLSNNVATGFLDNFSEYQIVLYDTGTAETSYGLGIKSNTMVFNSGGGAYSFDRAGNATSMYIETDGKVGIDTTTPAVSLDVNGLIRPSTYTVATLPAGVAGAIANVSDALAPVWGAAVAGGGAVNSSVRYNGAAWTVWGQ